jgi:hypothetical protein
LEEEEEEARLLINFSVRSLRVGRSAAQFHDGGTERVNNKRRAGPARLHEFDCTESHETKKRNTQKTQEEARVSLSSDRINACVCKFSFGVQQREYRLRIQMTRAAPSAAAAQLKVVQFIPSIPFLSLVLVANHSRKTKKKTKMLFLLDIIVWQFTYYTAVIEINRKTKNAYKYEI